MICSVTVHNNQQWSVRRYFAASKLFPSDVRRVSTHCERHYISRREGDEPYARIVVRKHAQVKFTLTWVIPVQTREVDGSIVDGRKVTWWGLALSCIMLCQALELWTYANGTFHLELATHETV